MIIRDFNPDDYSSYIRLNQRVFNDAYYPFPGNYPTDLFSMKNFSTAAMDEHFRTLTTNNSYNHTWVAEEDGEIIGSITLTNYNYFDEVRGFYVETKLQGQGIGKQLWRLMENNIKNKDLKLEVFSHAHKTINTYLRWGFVPQAESVGYIHWDDWPHNVVLETLKMIKTYDK